MAEHDESEEFYNAVGIEETSEKIMDDKKRKMVNILESERSPHPMDQVQDNIEKTESGNADGDLESRLHAALATCKMLEETVESFESRILESISENGSLRQKIDLLQEQMFDMKAKLASMQCQRDSLRDRLEDIINRSSRSTHALAAAEREISYLNARYQDIRLSKRN